MKTLFTCCLSMVAAASAQITSGTFSALTFNVAGIASLLQGNNVGDQSNIARKIGSLFAKKKFDIIHLQEDFNYHDDIYATDHHPWRTLTSGEVGIGDGLNTLSNYGWKDFNRVQWQYCSDESGYDCQTLKGFSIMRWSPAIGVLIDVYNLHADAGSDDKDDTARNENLAQLALAVKTLSIGNAVLIMGDTNSRYTRINDTSLRVLVNDNQLTDAWVEQVMGGATPPVGAKSEVCIGTKTTAVNCETVDKILYRSSKVVNLTATSFAYQGKEFWSSEKEALSDHAPALVHFDWNGPKNLAITELFGGAHGTWFNDLATMPASPVVNKIAFRSGHRLDAIGIRLSDGTSFAHGGTGGDESEMFIDADDWWISAKVCQGQRKSKTRIFYLSVTTYKGKNVEVGRITGDCKEFTAPLGWSIVGVMGQSGHEVDQLGFIYSLGGPKDI